MSGGGTSTTRTLVGTVVPTRTEKLTLLTRGTFPPAKTFSRISVRCSVVNNHQIARPCYFRTWATHKLGAATSTTWAPMYTLPRDDGKEPKGRASLPRPCRALARHAVPRTPRGCRMVRSHAATGQP